MSGRDPSQIRVVAQSAFTDRGRYPEHAPKEEISRRLEIYPKADRIAEKSQMHFSRQEKSWTQNEQARPYTHEKIQALQSYDLPTPTIKGGPTNSRIIGQPVSPKDASALVNHRQSLRKIMIQSRAERMVRDGKHASTGIITGKNRGGGTHRDKP